MNDVSGSVFRVHKAHYFIFAALALIMYFVFHDGIHHMVRVWETKEEYGHGFIIPLIVVFLIWQRSDKLEKERFTGSWYGFLIVAFGLLQFFAGELSSIYTLVEYSFVIVLIGLALSITGIRAFKIIAIPLIVLFFMVPFPNFFLFNISSQLQLISSQIGVMVIRLFDISVFLEGNVIDLGVYKLQVVEACSGLNYLFPLMTLAFISAYFFTGSLWKKAIIFLSSIPITILMNSFRIGAIGVTVEYWGPDMAEGFLHDFEGWAVFMSCIGILVLEMWILASIGKDKLPLRDAFGLDFPEPTPEGVDFKLRTIPKPFYASFSILFVVAFSLLVIPEQVEVVPERTQYSEFPLAIDNWQGKSGHLEQIYLDALKLSDYVLNDYIDQDNGSVNFYSAYYASQKKGASAHSPRSCIPGGGWRITSLQNHNVSGAEIDGMPMVVNRLVIEKGEFKQLVYYWFQQRGRLITNEYLMKWYLFWDSMALHRTDGALMRLTTVLKPGQDLSIADKRLEEFSRSIAPIIPEFVPGK